MGTEVELQVKKTDEGSDAQDVTKEKEQDKKKKKEKTPLPPRVPFSQLLRYSTTFDMIMVCLGSLGACANGVILPGFSLVFGELIDAFNKPGADMLDEITRIALYFTYIGIGALVVNFAQSACWNLVAARNIKRIREEFMFAIMRQEIGWFDQNPTGELTTRMSGDTIVIQEAIGDKVGTFLQFASTCVAGFILGFIRGWRLALVMLAVTPLLATAGAFMMKLMGSLSTKGQAAYAKAGAFATEALAGVRTVASFAAEPQVQATYRKNLVEARGIGIKTGFVSGLGVGITLFIMFGVYALALWYGTQLIIDGKMSGGDVMTVFFSVLMGAFALGQATPNLEAISKGQGAAVKIFETIDRKPLINSASNTGKFPKNIVGDIKLDQLFFTYPTRPDVQVLNGLELEIPAGKTVALVGHSGCGKSSIIQLIQRFYDPIDGKVTLDGKNIKKLNVGWLRRQIGLVGQEPVLFTGSIADNIRHGKPDATMEEIIAAAQASNAHDFIEQFPEQYDTQVGEKGAQMSGGQKQRIAIARAIIKNPTILLLDEATSALDAQSEKVVQDALNKLMKGRTTVVVAHRLSTIRDADIIAVIDHGRVVEKGTHTELVEKRGFYFDLIKAQSSEESEGKKEKKAQTRRGHAKTFSKESETDSKKEEEEEKLEAVSFGRLIALNKPELKWILLGCFASILNGANQPVFSIVFSEMINLFYKPKDEINDEVWKWAVAFVGLGCVPLIFITMQTTAFAVAGQWLTQRLRDQAFTAILRNHIGWFDKKENGSGILTARLASEAALVEASVGTRLGVSVQNICTLIAGLVIAFYYGWKLTLVVLATAPLIAFANAMHMATMKGYTEKYRKANESANQVATEAISNIRTVASFTREDAVLSSFVTKMTEPMKLGYRSALVRGFMTGLGQLFLMCSYTLSLWYGGKLINDGEYDFLKVMKVFMAIIMCAMGLGQTAGMMPDANKAKKAASIIFKLIDFKSEIDSSSTEGKQLETISGNIVLKDVSFTYPTRPDAPVLQKFNLVVKPGQHVALVGYSGCGKSSVVSLLERFYDPVEGEITLDGVNLKELNVRWLRQHIGFVGQEPVLFSGSIADNIKYGKPDATQEEIEAAAMSANAHNFISEFPDKYNTNVGEKGTQLSGGQKQRIAIARAIIKNPAVLLLDEATSALDTESEKIVQQALDNVMKGRTTIVIAHRLSTIRHANVIACIEAGQIVEIGTHEELMEKGGLYRQLVERQTL